MADRPDMTDFDFVARTVMAEAEGESYEGKVAVAAVIYNRARSSVIRWWGETIKDVCLTSKQFSAWNDASPRRNRIGEWNLGQRAFRECLRAAIEAYDRDPTGGADHYFAHGVVLPEWAVGIPSRMIDGHTFLRRELQT